MKLKAIIEFLEKEIPKELALPNDNVGLQDDYNLNQEINQIKIYMDLILEFDEYCENTLNITHHPPLFKPKNPTYTIHSNWDIIIGGANEALADTLNLKVIDYFDCETRIGRICKSNYNFLQMKKIIFKNFKTSRIVNKLNDEEKIEKIAIISGFGLKNPNYIKLAKNKNLNIIISGDLTHESAILAKNLGITLIDLGHHESEIPGLIYLKKLIDKLNIDNEIINEPPIEVIE
ncbi:MAG: Nif3-like dinuclear metal center hexameric protein [Methanobrevibacter sp.]|nr:Nif3-like dinuclear metal center hexameric protein [Methanobrevibacter sp.]